MDIELKRAKARVERAAMRLFRNEPVESARVGYMREFNSLIRACAALDKLTKGKK